MKASIKWLKEFADFSLAPEELADALTMTGLEVEDIKDAEGDPILEISVTPNRPDCLSIKGIAREISAILNVPLNDVPISIEIEEGVRPLIEIKEPDICPRYASRIIRGVKTGPSPEWITTRLQSHGIRPVNNVVDITNYVLLETGHPLHAFDLDRLEGDRIVVRTAGSANKFQTLDNEKRTLAGDMLMIWDEKKPVAIAGIMGGLDTVVSETTSNILLESAYFDPVSIRRTSKTLNLSSESSYRFERGADIKGVVPALNRVTGLIIEIAGGTATKTTDVYMKPHVSENISVVFEKINNILGVKVEPALIQELLSRLGIESRPGGLRLSVTPPSFRPDIQRDMDVIEEIARLYGYDNIPITLPITIMQPVSENPGWAFVTKVKDASRKAGYSEVINYSFLNPIVLDKLRIPEEDERRNLMKIRNPLKKEAEALRTTLIPALLENVRTNINRGEKSIRFFEVSRVFFDKNERAGEEEEISGEGLPNEVLKMAAVYLKDMGSVLWHNEHDGFYDIKGMLENLLLELGIRTYSIIRNASAAEPYLHPGKSCVIKTGDRIIGSLGTLHPDAAQNFDVPAETNLLEIDMEGLLRSIPAKISYSPLPRYPYVERDIAIIVSDDITSAKVEDTIWNINTGIIESINLFDIYTGKPIPKGQKSLAFSIRYRAGDHTLTDNEVNELHTKILEKLKKSLQAELRS
ncbi:MAG TPA: phenylalanine--tRNA ligase subunit beta [Nitrospirae bacterium]|nr:phenylalanine--tRNA ligase beta subunit [bacterium BMS3Abin10]HDK17137.1 phenylalanine--tRNA ligase subunit beta [Nitrospirota bacterium]HDK82351.1 phenylalanine--tRNA ligase subunit beta [Nitrospirota bacterium]HDO25623.1 phenylalanine--tRNA ligase subunit beta [Nitrospirota bacterium]